MALVGYRHSKIKIRYKIDENTWVGHTEWKMVFDVKCWKRTWSSPWADSVAASC
jgi:hypothetical protein